MGKRFLQHFAEQDVGCGGRRRLLRRRCLGCPFPNVEGAGARELRHACDRCMLILPHARIGRRSSPPPAPCLAPGRLALGGAHRGSLCFSPMVPSPSALAPPLPCHAPAIPPAELSRDVKLRPPCAGGSVGCSHVGLQHA
nr:unnamed protein product [Digitaria exilis]